MSQGMKLPTMPARARPARCAALPDAPCPHSHRAGGDGEKKAEIMRIGGEYARDSQNYDCSNGRSVVDWVADEAKAGASDNSREK